MSRCRCGAETATPDVADLAPWLAERALAMTVTCDACAAAAAAESAGMAARRAERAFEARAERSGLPCAMWGLGFDDHAEGADEPERLARLTAAWKWANASYGDGEPPGLLLWGPVGVGKTFLAATAAAVALRRTRLVWTTGPALMARLGAGFGSDELARGLDAVLAGPTPLVLDDLDKTAGASERARQYVFAAIDGRVSAGAQLLVTTNLHPADLAEALGEPFGAAIASRLAGHCRTFEMRGGDRRTR